MPNTTDLANQLLYSKLTRQIVFQDYYTSHG